MEATSTPPATANAPTTPDPKDVVVKAAEKFVDEFTAYRRASAQAGEAAGDLDNTAIQRAELELHRAVANYRASKK